MKKFNLNKAIRKFREVGLSHEEKSAMLSSILGKPAAVPVKSTFKPPFRIPSYFFVPFGRSLAYPMVVLVFVLGIGTSYAAEKAVPGDILYPVKVNINEPLVGAVTVGKEAKVEWEAQKAERRLVEAEVLASEGKLNETNRKEIETKFNQHSEKFSEISDDNQKPEAAEKAEKKDAESRGKFEARVEIQTQKLQHIKDSSDDAQKNEIQKLEKHVKEKVKEVREKKPKK